MHLYFDRKEAGAWISWNRILYAYITSTVYVLDTSKEFFFWGRVSFRTWMFLANLGWAFWISISIRAPICASTDTSARAFGRKVSSAPAQRTFFRRPDCCANSRSNNSETIHRFRIRSVRRSRAWPQRPLIVHARMICVSADTVRTAWHPV